MTVGPGIAPDLLTPAKAGRALAGWPHCGLPPVGNFAPPGGGTAMAARMARPCLLYARRDGVLLLLFLQGQHGAPAGRRAAQALVGSLELLGDLAVEHQPVVVEQFFAAGDVAQRRDVDALAVAAFLGFAVGLAGMVDPARVVAVVAAVDHAARTEREEEGVERIVGVGGVAAVGFLGADALAAVFDDARAGGDFARGEHAVAMQLGAAHDVPGLGGISSSGHE